MPDRSEEESVHDSAEYGVLYYRVIVLEREVTTLRADVRELEASNARWINRGIGVGLVISFLGATGGYLLAALRKLGF